MRVTPLATSAMTAAFSHLGGYSAKVVKPVLVESVLNGSVSPAVGLVHVLVEHLIDKAFMRNPLKPAPGLIFAFEINEFMCGSNTNFFFLGLNIAAGSNGVRVQDVAAVDKVGGEGFMAGCVGCYCYIIVFF